jgi:hypothetical protein
MTAPANEIPRRFAYVLLITVAAAMIGGRILGIGRVYEPYLFRSPGDSSDQRPDWPATRPAPMTTLGANDRSRWDTIRALVDNGTYAIGYRDPASASSENRYGDQGIDQEDGWQTIDKVLRPDDQKFYSSKPPLLPTIVAGEYWLLKHLLGWSITEQQSEVVRVVLLTVNWLPFVVYLILLATLVEQFGVSDWGRLYVLTCGCFATFISTFAVTLNNHTVAAYCVMFSLYSSVLLWESRRHQPAAAGQAINHFEPFGASAKLHAVAAGFFAGLAACTELPAACFAVAVFAWIALRGAGITAGLFLLAAVVPVAGFLMTNYWAIGQFAPAYSELGSQWYQYPGSYWNKAEGPKTGIDWAVEGKAIYAFHLLFGHHGLFSLSPIYVLSGAGMVCALATLARSFGSKAYAAPVGGLAGGWPLGPIRNLSALQCVGCLTFATTVCVVGFYVFSTHNYGGWTSGPRWLIWLSPLLLVTMLPCADALSRRRVGRVLGCVLLGISIAAASYPMWNPWRHPWLYDLLQTGDWLRY